MELTDYGNQILIFDYKQLAFIKIRLDNLKQYREI